MRKWMTRGLLAAAIVVGGVSGAAVGGTAVAADNEHAYAASSTEARWITIDSSHPSKHLCKHAGKVGKARGEWIAYSCEKWPGGVWRLWVTYHV